MTSASTLRIPVGPQTTVEVDVFTPRRLTKSAVVFYCVGGGNVTRDYFDLGGARGAERSFVRSMVARGHVVVTIDPIGVGGSTIPADGFELNIDDEARWIAAAVTELRARRVNRIDLGALFAVGIGHSAGGMIIGATQGLHSPFDATVLLGFGPAGLPSFVPDEIIDRLRKGETPSEVAPDLARGLFGDAGYFAAAPDPETEDGRLLTAVRCRYPAALGALAILPGNIASELREISTPVFIGISSDDLIEDPHQISTAFPGTSDFSLFILQEANHEIFLSPRIRDLYERIDLWLPAARLVTRAVAPKTSTAHTTLSAGRYDLTKARLGALIDDPEAAAIIEKHIPGMTAHKMIKMARSTPISRILPMTGVEDATQRALLEELAQLATD